METNEIVEMIKNLLGEMLNLDPEEISEDTSFFKLGISSVQALKIVNIMRKKLDVEINPVAMFEFKCITDLAEYLNKLVQEKN